MLLAAVAAREQNYVAAPAAAATERVCRVQTTVSAREALLALTTSRAVRTSLTQTMPVTLMTMNTETEYYILADTCRVCCFDMDVMYHVQLKTAADASTFPLYGHRYRFTWSNADVQSPESRLRRQEEVAFSRH